MVSDMTVSAGSELVLHGVLLLLAVCWGAAAAAVQWQKWKEEPLGG
jgi:hypothetical protein